MNPDGPESIESDVRQPPRRRRLVYPLLRLLGSGYLLLYTVTALLLDVLKLPGISDQAYPLGFLPGMIALGVGTWLNPDESPRFRLLVGLLILTTGVAGLHLASYLAGWYRVAWGTVVASTVVAIALAVVVVVVARRRRLSSHAAPTPASVVDTGRRQS